MEIESKKRFLINFLYIFVIGGITVVLCRFLLGGMLPFLFSIIIAAVSQKPARFVSKKTGLSKKLCAVFLSAAIYIVFVALFGFFFWKIILSSSGIIEYLPDLFEKVMAFFKEAEKHFSASFPEDFSFPLTGVADNFLNTLTTFLTNIVKKTIKGVPTFLLSSIVALVASCYISKDFDGLSRFIKSLCKNDFYEKLSRVKNILTQSVFKIVKGYIILMIITFFEMFLGLTILKVKNAFIIAVLIAFVDILPVLGTGIILVPWAIYCIISGAPALAVGVSILYVITLVIRNFLEPKIVSQQIGINPLFTLVSMFAGLKLFGGVGLILFPLILIVTIKYYKEEM